MSPVFGAERHVAHTRNCFIGAGLLAPEVAEQNHAIHEVAAVGRDDTRFAAADRFGALHTEAVDRTKATHLTASPTRTVRVAAIFDNRQSMFLSDGDDAIHIADVAEDMHDTDGFGAR